MPICCCINGSLGQPPRYKARLIARGLEQRHEVDLEETFASVVKWKTIQLVSGVAAHVGWPLHHLDVETTFLNGILQEEVYLTQHEGFIIKGQQRIVCPLRRSLYG